MNDITGKEGNKIDNITPGVGKPKRKKTSRACTHCQKSHMTCDSNRPCKRCIKRGLESTCQDAPRKLKKYLAGISPSDMSRTSTMNTDNIATSGGAFTDMSPSSSDMNNILDQRKDQGQGKLEMQSGLTNKDIEGIIYPARIDETKTNFISQPNNSYVVGGSMPVGVETSSIQPNVANNPNLLSTSNPKGSAFLSTAADLEYSTLSSILQDNFSGFNHKTSSTEGTPNSYNVSTPTLSPNVSPNLSAQVLKSNLDQIAVPGHHHKQKEINGWNNITNPAQHEHSYKGKNGAITKNSIVKDKKINQYFLGAMNGDAVTSFPDVIEAIQALKAQDPAVFFEESKRSVLSFVIRTSDEGGVQDSKTIFKDPDEIYAKVLRPFSYTPGYHSLIAYLRKRFPREMLVKMAESMASYRPSFIASTNNLKESDLIFMEQCFQRTLLTYDNFIKVSGTPTIVWRRTGEIVYVGHEFCILTGWSREDLLLKEKKFIVELLDDESVVEYFQLFSRIAYGDFFGATMTECTLLTPRSEVKIRTECIWTLKRDVFGIPMMIIGNFLPIL